MEYKHAIVINKDGYMQEFVLVKITETESGLIEEPQYYEMQPGDKLIYDGCQIANSMLKPQWKAKGWKETATPEEIQAEKEKQLEESGEQYVPQPNQQDLAIAELTAMVATMQMQNDLAMAEMLNIVVGGEIDV